MPLYALIGVGRALLLALSRRFEDAYDVVAAWGWNVAHLPGTVRRRFRAQSVRTVKDRDIRRFMESATVRLPRWLDEASAILSEQIKIDDDEPPGRRLRARTRSLLESHPVLVGGAAAVVVGFLVAGPVLGADPLTGGVTPAFPSSPASFFQELASGVRTTVLGGAQAASPALGALGGLSWVLLGSTELAHRVLVVALPFIAAAMCYRAVGRQTGERLGATVAAGVYGSSAVVLWAFSQGRIDLLVALAVLPVLVERIGAAFMQEGGSRLRTAAGLGVALGIGISFLPGMLLPVAVVILVHLVTSPARLRGLVTVGAGVVAGAALAFPLLPAILAHPSPTLASLVGDPSFWALARTVLGPGPGSWSVASFLPIAALVSIVIVRTEHRAAANRLALVGVAGIFLAWSSAAGYLPEALSNPPAYVALVAVAEAFLVGFGVASLASGFAREAFGIRQILAVGLTALLVGGLSLQALGAIAGSKEIGQDRLPPAWPVVSEGAKGDFRVLWIGRDDGMPFPAPGGDPSGVVEAGPASLRYGLTDREGVSALDIGRRDYGGGYETLERTLAEAVSGGTRHLGALLAPFGVRYVVAGGGDLPAPVLGQAGSTAGPRSGAGPRTRDLSQPASVPARVRRHRPRPLRGRGGIGSRRDRDAAAPAHHAAARGGRRLDGDGRAGGALLHLSGRSVRRRVGASWAGIHRGGSPGLRVGDGHPGSRRGRPRHDLVRRPVVANRRAAPPRGPVDRGFVGDEKARDVVRPVTS